MRKILTAFFVFILWLLITPAEIFAQAAQTATLSLSPSTGTFNPGCSFTASVNLDTGGVETDGTDAILIYDPTRLTATQITNGSIYPDYPGNNIDPQKGTILISGLASVTTPFKGQGLLASVNFTVANNAPPGVTEVKFDFDSQNKGKTTDSNVVQRVTVVDVLNSVVNGSYTVGNGSGNCASASPSSGGGARGGPFGSTPSATPRTLDCTVDKTCKGTGTIEFTATVAIVGGVLTVLGILGLALL